MEDRINLLGLRRNQMVDLLAKWGYSKFHSGLLWRYLYRDQVGSIGEMSELRDDLRSSLSRRTFMESPSLSAQVSSEDGLTVKLLLTMRDGQSIEAVLMRYPGRATVCVSTQVGCAMGCVFCATGQMGFVRNLSAGEIVAQILYSCRLLAEHGEALRNVVFMGMGEPLHNYEATMAAIDIITDDHGPAIGPRYVTLSTVGLPAAIRRLADEDRAVNLAVSLHAASDEDRDKLIPVNRRWKLSQIIEACQYYCEQSGKRIFFEWALIGGRNDSTEQAQRLGRLLDGLEAHVNLIPLNPTKGYNGLPSNKEAIRSFQLTLAEYGVPSTVRKRRGLDIDAGCGQLRGRK